MKNKRFLFFGRTLIIGMAFGLALAGCPTDGGDPSVEASQLAADINKISAGSATVNGATVTLSKKLSLESQFTVPAGVTLDLTGNGELALLDATLTVNGTVKAGTGKIHMGSAASWGAINGSGTIQLKGQGCLLYIGDNNTLTLDGVTLVGLADNNRPLVEVVGDIENGYMGKFIMKNGAITGNTYTDDDWADGGGVALWGGTFIMEGGTISGNSTAGNRGSGGGGVAVSGKAFSGKPGGTFIMEGGVISGNSAGEGGGVKVVHNGLFTLKGGRIQGGTDSDGFTKNRNTDNGNSAALCVVWGGRAVWGTGGTYTGGYSQAAETSIVVEMNPNNGWGGTDDTLIAAADGGDPSAEASQLAAAINKMSAGSATVDGATVTLSGKLSLESQFTVPVGVTLAVPAGVTLDLTGDGGLVLRNAALTVNGTVNAGPQSIRLDAERGAINGSGTIQLKGKGRLLDIRDNRTLTLDGVTLAGVADNDGSLVVVHDGGTFVMKSGAITGNTNIGDGSVEGGGVAVREGGAFIMKDGAISGNTTKSNAKNSRGGGVIVRKGSFIMEGGAISGNTAESGVWSEGGGVAVDDWGTFIMKDGVISGNTAQGIGGNGSSGGGVAVREESTFTMTGSTISKNTAGGGGGVSVGGEGATCTMTSSTISENTVNGEGGGVRVGGGGTFTMESGAITNNTVTGGGGGGLLVHEGSTFILKDGVISGNSAQGMGGGVEMYKGAFTMQGGTISGNTTAFSGGGVMVRGGGAIFTMQGGMISGNTAQGQWAPGGGVSVGEGDMFIMQGGTIYGKTGSLPASVDPSFANIASNSNTAALSAGEDMAKWGTGGTYTKGGVDQPGGTSIVDGGTDDTLIAIPAP